MGKLIVSNREEWRERVHTVAGGWKKKGVGEWGMVSTRILVVINTQ